MGYLIFFRAPFEAPINRRARACFLVSDATISMSVVNVARLLEGKMFVFVIVTVISTSYCKITLTNSLDLLNEL